MIGDPPIPGFRPDQLQGFRIGVTSDRRSGDLIDALERRGAQVLHAPAIQMANTDADDPVIADTRTVLDAKPDILLATTAYGIRRWFEVADAAGLGDALVATLADVDILVRGPKARGGIRAAGLDDHGMSDEETTASLIDRVLERYSAGKVIIVQVHGYTDEPQLERLRSAGHRVLTVSPYRWLAPDASDGRVLRLIDAACSGRLDCITFTSAPAVDALFRTAELIGRREDLIRTMSDRVLAAAVGPVTAAPLIKLGVTPIQPDRHRMGALIRLVCEELEERRVEYVTSSRGTIELRGSMIIIDGVCTLLPPSSLMLFRIIARARGAVVTR
ncbi:MAG TPA: uroporphyrinogen-III synthase, partial [Humibacter sp.]|nr:uroporphyrinogen-III synthase [Humibacter sp.]